MNTIEESIFAYLNDESSTDDVKRLFEWVRADPENAREFARCSLLHAQLRGQFIGEQLARDSGELRGAADGETDVVSFRNGGEHIVSLRRRRRLSYVLAATVAASLLAALTFLFPLLSTPSKPFATIDQAADAEWGGASLREGDRVANQTLHLRRGIVRLVFDDGAEVTIQGPAQYQLTAPGETTLTSGLLTASVPPGAEGFRVATPTIEIVDLGTAFGIELDDDGVANVSVFDGEVEVTPIGGGVKQLLKEGEAVRVTSGKAITLAKFDASVYEELWPTSSGIKHSTGAFRLTPPWAQRLRFVQSDDDIFVLPQPYSTTLVEPLQANIASPGVYDHADNLTPAVIAAGRAVRSFILHFQPERRPERRRFKRTTGSITFNRPVLGLIVLHEELAASAGRFPGPKAGEFLEHRQLELSGNRVGDRITLSSDFRTVSLDLAAPGRFSDLVRVIVDASTDPLERKTSQGEHDDE